MQSGLARAASKLQSHLDGRRMTGWKAASTQADYFFGRLLERPVIKM
jgi:hypothetical protein